MPGSNGAAPFDKFEIPDLIKSRTCLLPMVSDLSRDLLTLHAHYRNNVLINAGGLLDQPNLYLEAMELITNGIQSSQQ